MSNMWLASILKELRLLSRNVHALLVLFVMPLVFVLIMSLALQDKIAGRTSVQLVGEVVVSKPSDQVERFRAQLFANDYLVEKASAGRDAMFKVELLEGFDTAVDDEFDGEAVVLLSYSPRFSLRERSLVLAAAKEAFAKQSVAALAAEMGFDDDYIESGMLKEGAVINAAADLGASQSELKAGLTVNATQQNIPAWLVFAMFFISLPIATVVLYEQRQLTLVRVSTLGLPASLWLLAKLVPYFFINMLQFVFLMVVGVAVLPLFGAEPLSLNVSLIALIAMAGAVSIAALGLASLIACASRSAEQATILAGTSNILLGAIGGIMVPKFVMPELMQQMTFFSPMGWGLEGFIKVLAFGGGLNAIYTELLVLVVLGIVSVLIANQILKQRIQ